MLLIASCAWGNDVTLPNGYGTSRFGPDGTERIFNNFDNRAPSRHQQVFGPSVWTSQAIRFPVLITSVAFRPDDRFIPPLGLDYRTPVTFDSLTIQLSTTSKGVDSLSPTFAQNIGIDVVTVFDGAFTMSYRFNSSETAFGSPIVFTKPFYFDPSKGNLLFDITKVGDGRLGYNLDAVRSSTDNSSSVGRVGGPDPTGGLDTIAFIMHFTYDVPEPSALALTGLAGIVGALMFPRRGRYLPPYS